MAGRDAHYLLGYDRRRRLLVAAANANSNTKCWRCGLTLEQHQPHHSGKPAKWTAGHVRDGDPLAPLLPEASTCNYSAGAQRVNGKPIVRPTRRW